MNTVHHVSHRLWTGSQALGLRLWTGVCSWCAKSYRSDLQGLAAALGPIARGSALVAAGWAGTYGVAAAPDTLYVIVFAWGIGAWNMAPPAVREYGADDEDEAEESDPLTPVGPQPLATTVTLEAFATLVRELAAGGAGAHFSTLAERITGDKENTAAVKALCAAHGVPRASSVRQGVGASSKVSSGVRVEDLPTPYPTPTGGPVVAVVSAGQTGTTGPTTTTATPRVKQVEWGLTLPDPAAVRHSIAPPGRSLRKS